MIIYMFIMLKASLKGSSSLCHSKRVFIFVKLNGYPCLSYYNQWQVTQGGKTILYYYVKEHDLVIICPTY